MQFLGDKDRFSGEALFSYGAAHHTPLLKWGYDAHDPKGRLFWLGLRNESTDGYTHLPIEGLVKVHNLWKGEATQIVLDKESENDSESLLD